jgi:hypothetical protein
MDGYEERSEELDKFKIFKAKVENKQNVKIKIVRSDRGESITINITHMATFLDLMQGFYRKMV